MKVPVSRRALIQRINRYLAERRQQLRSTGGRSATQRQQLGDFYIVDLENGQLVETRIDIEGYARQLRLLKNFEQGPQ